MKDGLLILWWILVGFIFTSCEGVRFKRFTPENYLNHTVANKDQYAADSAILVKQFKQAVINHEGFFLNGSYDATTEIRIDSILYSPDIRKMIVFVIARNPTTKQIRPVTDYKWYYDGTCYLGFRHNDTIQLRHLGPNFTNSYDYRKLSAMMRDAYFTAFATEDTVGLNTYKYNLNDIRFWKDPVWREFISPPKQ